MDVATSGTTVTHRVELPLELSEQVTLVARALRTMRPQAIALLLQYGLQALDDVSSLAPPLRDHPAPTLRAIKGGKGES